MAVMIKKCNGRAREECGGKVKEEDANNGDYKGVFMIIGAISCITNVFFMEFLL